MAKQSHNISRAPFHTHHMQVAFFMMLLLEFLTGLETALPAQKLERKSSQTNHRESDSRKCD